MNCKLCHNNRPLVKSHIIPESFYRLDRQGGTAKLKTDIEGIFPSRAPIGIYDRIVCEECERLFSSWDDYAQKLLLGSLWQPTPIFHEGKVLSYTLDSFDYSKLKLFCLSVLWRASVSSHRFFSKIDLGPYEGVARSALLAGDPGQQEFFASLLGKFDIASGTAVLDPHREKIQGVNFSRFYMAEFMLFVKIDRRGLLDSFKYVALAPGKPLIVMGRELQRSEELSIMKNIIRVNR